MAIFGSLSFEVPPEFSDRSQVLLLGPIEGNFQENWFITQDTDAKENDLVAYVDEQIAAFHEEAQDYVLIERSEHTLDGQPALSLEHRFEAEGAPIAQLQVFVKRSEGIQVIAFTHHAEFFSETKKRAEAFLKTLKLL